MKLPSSTEWVLHCATTLAQLNAGDTASTAQLAKYFDISPTYLAKQLQLLVKAGILSASTGPRGGFQLARDAASITLLEIVEALDGKTAPYICQELRQRGVGALPARECHTPCVLAVKMAQAHRAWQESLSAVSLHDIVASLPHSAPSRTQHLLQIASTHT